MTTPFPVTIYHNPNCGTSRNALAAIRAAGVEPTVVEYVKAGWTREELEGLFTAMGARPRDLLRTRGTPAEELGLSKDSPDAAILDAMLTHPILVERPIVASPKGTKLCRPSETVREVLP
jgi:arsenate reductase